MSRSKRVLVTLPPDTYSTINRMKGRTGNSRSEVIRNILIEHFTEEGKSRIDPIHATLSPIREPGEFTLGMLLELLIHKKLITQSELSSLMGSNKRAIHS